MQAWSKKDIGHVWWESWRKGAKRSYHCRCSGAGSKVQILHDHDFETGMQQAVLKIAYIHLCYLVFSLTRSHSFLQGKHGISTYRSIFTVLTDYLTMTVSVCSRMYNWYWMNPFKKYHSCLFLLERNKIRCQSVLYVLSDYMFLTYIYIYIYTLCSSKP